ncbi:MAG: STAS domain-containing protein [Planctomycetes bacterium]|nr:STAS domain-containing protein [Planctomycetota bacterium]MCK5564074.1 STAS domain-containing protein [Planctomycetota bacterium]
MDQEKVIDITNENGVAIVKFTIPSISGTSGIDHVAAQLRQFMQEASPKKIVIDFSQVKFFSSQMLGLLVDIWKKIQEDSGILAISGINPDLNRVFKITNLDKIFKFYPDAISAVKDIS